MAIPGFKFVDTWKFREAAIYFEQHGCYDDGGVEGTLIYDQYWTEQERRCLEGLTVNIGGHDVRISGYHYFYLNFCPIEQVLAVNNGKDKTKRTAAKRFTNFPKFWDLDWIYFTALDIAEYGLPGDTYEEQVAYYESLPLDIDLVLDEDNIGGGKHLLWLKFRGCGAEQPHSEVIMSPAGPTTMGNMKVGSIIYDRLGRETRVLEVFPQGKKDIYEVTLIDGRVVRCGANHLWTVQTRVRDGKPVLKTLKTIDMMKKGISYPLKNGQKAYNYKLPKIEPVPFSEKELPVDPYILGALLGNGAMKGSNIRLATIDDEMVQEFERILGPDYELNRDYTTCNYLIKCVAPRSKFKGLYEKSHFGCNPLLRELGKLKVNVGCHDKFIPEVYKYGSIEQRLELVRGLLDTDGSISKDGSIEFVSASKSLIDDLAYVLRSLGVRCRLGLDDREGRSHVIADNNVITIQGVIYRLYISTALPVFKLSRKACKINATKRRFDAIAITSIVNTGEQEEQSCIMVDNDEHLYLTTDFVPTHNSWKGASMPARNFFFIRHSNSYMYADSTQYLTKDGVFTKFELYKNFINLNTPFTKFTDVKNSANEMHIRASHRDLSGNEKGYMSEVMGVTVNGKPDSVRGKRGKVVLFEEFGTFNKGGDVFSVTKSSLEEANLVFGTAILYGTAGIDGKAFETMEKMFYSPKAFGLLRFNNTLDDDLIGTECALFTPADYNVANVDSEGNSNREVTRMFIEKERAIIGKSSDANDAAKAKMEHPLRPGEALLRSNDSILPKAELLAWKTELVASHQSRTAVYGFFEGDTFKPSPDARPIVTFPHKKTDVITGCVTVWQSPYKKDGYVPDNLYIVCVDPYMHDSSQGDSLGAAYVIKNINNFSKPDDQIVASFVGRPKTMDEFHRNVEKLARMYNAKIGYENNAGQGLLSYFKSKNLLTMLAKEFELGYNENMPKSTVKRGFGMHIDGYRKKLGISYLADWLTKPWMTDENGVQLYNYHKIYDLGLLEELIKFSEDRNVDRVSAMIIAMFHMKEIEHKLKGPVTDNRKKKIDPFFKTILYKE